MTEKLPLYKVLENIKEKQIKEKYMELDVIDDNDKKNIYQSIKREMEKQNNFLYLSHSKNPFVIKDWIESEHHIKCSVEEIQIINGPCNTYKDTHYCYISW